MLRPSQSLVFARPFLLAVALLPLLPAPGHAFDGPFCRCLGIGHGPGYHANDCCQGDCQAGCQGKLAQNYFWWKPVLKPSTIVGPPLGGVRGRGLALPSFGFGAGAAAIPTTGIAAYGVPTVISPGPAGLGFGGPGFADGVVTGDRIVRPAEGETPTPAEPRLSPGDSVLKDEPVLKPQPGDETQHPSPRRIQSTPISTPGDLDETAPLPELP